jgi:EthD domain
VIKCITLLRDEADSILALADRTGRTQPLRLALCRVRNPGEIVAVELSWYADLANVHEARGASETIIVEERVARGEDWLKARWGARRAEHCPLLIGLIRRAAHLSREAFGQYWWHQHRPLADGLVPPELNPVAYVHNYARADQHSAWDGIGELYEASLRVARSRGEWFESEAAAPLLADEERFMDRASRQVLVTDQEILLA